MKKLFTKSLIIIFLFSISLNAQFSKDKLYPIEPDKIKHFFRDGIIFTISYNQNHSFWKSIGISFGFATFWELLNAVGISDDPKTIFNFKGDGFSYNDIIAGVIGSIASYGTIKLFEWIFDNG